MDAKYMALLSEYEKLWNAAYAAERAICDGEGIRFREDDNWRGRAELARGHIKRALYAAPEPGALRAALAPRPSPLSPEAKAARTPRPPEELVDALHDPIHAPSGRLLASKPIVSDAKEERP